jgi:hypothetical protein
MSRRTSAGVRFWISARAWRGVGRLPDVQVGQLGAERVDQALPQVSIVLHHQYARSHGGIPLTGL